MPGVTELALLALILVAAVVTALIADELGAIVAFAGYSLGMAVLWVVLRAPDVGLTEAAVGAGVMTILFLLAIAKTTRPSARHGFDLDPLAGSVALGIIVVLLATVPSLPAVGDPTAPSQTHVAPFYLENAYADTGVENAVTAVLASYRGFDTFGEVTVVFAAAVAVLVVFHKEVWT